MERPNVVMVTVDCLRYDRCSFDGHDWETTPTLDGVAREAAIFDAAVAPGPRTNESVPGILAGLLSSECAYYDGIAFKAIPPEAPTLATWLRDRGYRTVAAVSNPQLTTLRNFDRGFDEFVNLRAGGDAAETGAADGGTPSRLPEYLEAVRGRLRPLVRDRIRERGPRTLEPATAAFVLERIVRRRSGWPTVPGEDVVDRLLSMLESSGGDGPVFAWTHLNDLHAPLHPDRVREGGRLANPSDLTQYRWDLRRVTDRYEPNYAAMYESTLRYVDAQIGRLVEHLESIGEWDRTVFVVTADHGEALYDRGVYGHAAGRDQYAHDPTRDYMYEELLHVPLLVREPDREATRIRSAFSLVWLHELLAEVLGIEPGGFARRSGRESHLDPESDAIVLADAMGEDGHTVAVRRGRLKRISQCLGGERGSFGEDPLRFDLEIDPGERTDLSPVGSTPDLDAATERAFTRPERLRPLEGELDAETREQLDRLGYQ